MIEKIKESLVFQQLPSEQQNIIISEIQEIDESTENVDRTNEITEIIATAFNQSQNNGHDYIVTDDQFRISQLVCVCLRKTLIERDLARSINDESIFFEFQVINPDQYNDNKLDILVIGNVFHNSIEGSLKSTNHLISSEKQVKIELTVNERNIELIGHFDLLLQVNNKLYIVDIKTTKSVNWQVENKYLPKQEHIEQLNLYLHALGIEQGSIVYIDKSDGVIFNHPVNYSSSIYEYSINNVTKMLEIEESKKLPPPKEIWLCKFCQFNDVCWSNAIPTIDVELIKKFKKV
jgi:CRISPR-associated exonuclease Cas4